MTEKEREARRAQWWAVKHHLELADRLRSQGAPSSLVEDEEYRSRSARLRLWGWTGEVPR